MGKGKNARREQNTERTPMKVQEPGNFLSRLRTMHCRVNNKKPMMSWRISTPPITKSTNKIAILGDSISTYQGYSEPDRTPYYPTGDVDNANYMWYVSSSAHISTYYAYHADNVRPCLYLSSNVQIIGGDGNTIPFKLAI